MLLQWALVAIGVVTSSLGASVHLPRADENCVLPYGKGAGSEGYAELIENNDKRLRRADQLQNNIDTLVQDLISDEEALNSSDAYFQEVYSRFAKQIGYPTLEDLIDDVNATLINANLPGQKYFSSINDKSHRLETALFSLAAIGVGGGAGTTFLAFRYGVWPSDSFTTLKLEMYKFAALVWNRVGVARAGATRVFRGIMQTAEWAGFRTANSIYNVRGLGPIIAHRINGQWIPVNAVADEIPNVAGRVAANIGEEVADVAIEGARATSVASRVGAGLLVFEAAIVVASIWLIVADKNQRETVRSDLNGAIKDLQVSRFQIKKLSMQGKPWDLFNARVAGATAAWLALQDEADTGGSNSCYPEADERLAAAYDDAFADLVGNITAITDEAVWAQLQKEDCLSNGGDPWVLNDYNYDELMNYFNTHPEGDEDETEFTDEQIQESLEASLKFQYGISQEPTPVNVTNVRYVELAGNRGAVWRLAGPFWQYQPGVGPDGTGNITTRYRLEEKSRAGSVISTEVVYTHTGDATDDPAVNNGLELKIDMKQAKVTFNGTDMDMLPDESQLLVPANGWTAINFFTNTTADPTPLYTEAYECNPLQGWTLKFRPGISLPTQDHRKEMHRDRDSVYIATYDFVDENYEEVGYTYPQFNFSMSEETLVRYVSETKSIPYPLVPGMTRARTTIG